MLYIRSSYSKRVRAWQQIRCSGLVVRGLVLRSGWRTRNEYELSRELIVCNLRIVTGDSGIGAVFSAWRTRNEYEHFNTIGIGDYFFEKPEMEQNITALVL